MNDAIQQHFEDLESNDRDVQFNAFQALLEATNEEVEWAYEVWDDLVEGLTSSNNHTRSRTAQFISRLAISDPEKTHSN